MMKSLRNRILGVIVCAALVVGTVTVPSNAAVEPTQNTETEGAAVPSGNVMSEENMGDEEEQNAQQSSVTENMGASSSSDAVGTWSFEDELAAVKGMKISTSLDEIEIDSGKTAVLRIIMRRDGSANTAEVDASLMTATVYIPEGLTVSVRGNTNFNCRDEDIVPDGNGGTIAYLSFNNVPLAGQGWDYEALLLTSQNGITPNGNTDEIHVQWKYGDEIFIEDEVNELTYSTSRFGWGNPTHSVSPASPAANRTDTEITVPDLTVSYSLANNFNSTSQYGIAYTKAVTILDEIEVDEKLIVTAAMLDQMQWSYNGAIIDDASYNIIEYHDQSQGYVKTFQVITTVNNTTLSSDNPGDISTISSALKLLITGLQVNEEKANEQVAEGATGTLQKVLYSNNTIAYMFPAVEVDISSSNNNIQVDDGGQQYSQTNRTGTTFSVNVSYTRPEEEVPPEPDDPWQTGAINKSVASVKNVLGDILTAAEDLMYAYYGDRVTYQFTEFGNVLEETELNNFILVDEFDPEQMYPVSLTTGAYNSGGTASARPVTIRLYEKSGNNYVEIYSQSYATSSATTLNLLNISTIDVTKIAKIEYDFSGFVMPAGFTVKTAPTVTMTVRNLGSWNPAPGSGVEPTKIRNSAMVSYSVEDETYNYDNIPEEEKGKENNFLSEKEITYYGNELPEDSTKVFKKVNGPHATSGKIEVDDILQYTISFRNPGDQYAKNPFFDDIYTGQIPYLTDSLGYGLTQQGFGEEPFIKVEQVLDADGNDVTINRGLTFAGAFVGPISWEDGKTGSGTENAGAYRYSEGNEPTIEENMMRVRFNSTNNIEPGDIIIVSYMMQVTEPESLSNRFKAYGYPIYSGSEELIPFTGGESDHGSGEAEVLQPTVSLTQTVTRTEGSAITGSPTSSTYPVQEDEVLDVKLVFRNSSVDKAPPMTLLGFAGGLTTNNQNVLQFEKGETLEAKIYKNSSDQNPEIVQVKVSNAPSGMNVPSNSTEKMVILFDDPITIHQSAYVELTYHIRSTGVGDNSKSTKYQALTSYAILQDGSSDYTSTSGSKATCSWIDGAQSMLSLSANIYIVTSEIPVVQSRVFYQSSPNTMGLNVASGSNPIRQRTGLRGFNAEVRNTGTMPFEVEKVYFRLPKNERLLTVQSSSTGDYTGKYYDWRVVGIYGEGDDKRQIIELTHKGGPNTVAPGSSMGYNNSSPSTGYYLVVETQMEEEVAQELMNSEAYRGKSAFSDSYAEIAFYSPTYSEFQASSTSYPIQKMDQSDAEQWGGSEMGIDFSQGSLYRVGNTVTGNYIASYSQPGIQMKEMEEENGTLQEVTDTDKSYSPYERMGWKITAKSNTLALKDPAVVVRLPADTTYTHVVEPLYAANAEVYAGADGYEYVIVPLNKDLSTSEVSFTIGATLGTKYGSKTAEAYLVSEQYFYQVISGWGNLVSTNLPNNIQSQLLFTPSENMVKTTNTIRVSGRFAFYAFKDVSVSGGGTPIDRGVEANFREDQELTYTLTLNNESSGRSSLPYNNLAIIDRLPTLNDKFVIVDGSGRGSTTETYIITEPIVQKYKINADGSANGSITTLTSSDYSIEYANVAADYAFSNADFGLADDGDTPSTPASWVSAGSWPDDQPANAFRVILNDDLDPEHAIRVTFSAAAPSELMPRSDAVAVNSFAVGFESTINSIGYSIRAESDYVQVTFPDIPEMVIKGTVFTENPDKENGIYEPDIDSIFSDFDRGDITLTLYKRESVNGAPGDGVSIEGTYPLDPNRGTYEFGGIYDEGFYFVGISELPEGYELYHEYVNEEQGNKFFYSTSTTDMMEYEEGETYIRNADIVLRVNGTLTIEKKLRSSIFSPDEGMVGTKPQKFVFKIEYTPFGASAPTRTFYEVLNGNESKVIVDLPQGTYTVTEMENWAVDYIRYTDTVYKNGQEITRLNQNISAAITNSRYQKPFFHAIASVLNEIGNNKGSQGPGPDPSSSSSSSTPSSSSSSSSTPSSSSSSSSTPSSSSSSSSTPSSSSSSSSTPGSSSSSQAQN